MRDALDSCCVHIVHDSQVPRISGFVFNEDSFEVMAIDFQDVFDPNAALIASGENVSSSVVHSVLAAHGRMLNRTTRATSQVLPLLCSPCIFDF